MKKPVLMVLEKEEGRTAEEASMGMLRTHARWLTIPISWVEGCNAETTRESMPRQGVAHCALQGSLLLPPATMLRRGAWRPRG